MRWEDERWVKVYTRDTGEWLALGWEAQALFLFALRKADRAGILKTGKMRTRGLAGMTGMPLEVVERSILLLLEDGCVREADGGYVIPNFLTAQEAQTSAGQRKRDQRERDRARALAEGMPEDTSGMVIDSMATLSVQEVTPGGHAMLSRQEVTQSQPPVTPGSHAGMVTPRVDETRVDETRVDETRVDETRSASQGTQVVPPSGEFTLTPTSPRQRKQRTASAGEQLFQLIQSQREARCAEVDEPVVPESWPFDRQNKVMGDLLRESPEAKERFEAAWSLYLGDMTNRNREPAWSLSYFLSSGVRAKYETRAAREGAP